MSLDSFLNKLSGLIDSKLKNAQIDTTAQVSNPFKGSVDASIFEGADINSFKDKIASGMNLDGDESIFYQNINEAGVEDVFDFFDKNDDGVIDADELKQISSADSKDDDISGYDLNVALNSMAYEKIFEDFDAMVKAGLVDREQVNNQAMQDYTSNIGGSNYQNYGSQTQNGSTISSPEQFSTKEKLDKIENEEIPALEKEKQEIIEKAQTDIDAKNEELDKLVSDNEEKLGKLGEDYTKKQDEIQQCDTKISDFESKIAKSESEKGKHRSTLSNLEAELGALDTSTNDEEINKSNKERKTQIESQINDLKEKIADEDKKIKEYQDGIKEQQNLKSEAQEKLIDIQEQIAQKNPEIAESMKKIQDEIKAIEDKKTEDIAGIDKEIKAKQEEANKYQKEIGEKTGQAESMTGSKMVQSALELAQAELAKGVHEISGNNDGTEIDKYRNGAANGQPWCASFVSWIYGAGQNSDNAATFGYDASVAGIRGKAESAGHYAQKGSYTPVAGDLMIQQNNASHVGMVTSVDPDGTIHTIEGNSSDQVAQRTYAPGSTGYNKISGWVKMNEWLSAK